MQNDFETLKLLTRRAKDVPHLRSRAQALVEAIDQDIATTSTLESIILSDPALSARVLRTAATNKRNPHDARFTTLHGAILRLGFNSIRTIAISLSVQGFLSQMENGSFFSTERFARHSLFVAYMASHIFEQKLHAERIRSSWAPDEVLAAGIVHDLGDALFWLVSPEDFVAVHELARSERIAFAKAFDKAYGHPSSELSEVLFDAWHLPNEFLEVVRYMRSPWEHPSKEPAIYAVHYANLLASASGFGKCDWTFVSEPTQDVVDMVGLNSDQMNHAIGVIGQIVAEQCAADASAA